MERKVNDKIYFVKIHTSAKLTKINLHSSNFAEGFNFNYYAILAYQEWCILLDSGFVLI